MAAIRVGVKKIHRKTGFEADPGTPDEDVAEVFQLWVEINGHRFSTEELNLIGVSYQLGRHRPRQSDGFLNAVEEPDQMPNSLCGEITLVVASSAFETVDHREPEVTGGD